MKEVTGDQGGDAAVAVQPGSQDKPGADTAKSAVSAEETRRATLRALGEAALSANPSDRAYLDSVVLELNSDQSCPVVAQIRGLVEMYRDGQVTQSAAQERIAKINSQVTDPSVTISGAGPSNIVATGTVSSTAPVEVADGTPVKPGPEKTVALLSSLGLTQKTDGHSF